MTPVFTAGRVTGAVMVFSDSRLRPDLDGERGGIFDTGVVGMVVLGLDGDYLQVNPSFCEMLGTPRTSWSATATASSPTPTTSPCARPGSPSWRTGEVPG